MRHSTQPQHPEYQYLNILQEILDHGDKRMDRTGVGTLALFGRHMRFGVSQTFPVFTTRKIYWRTAIKEMLWILSGSRPPGRTRSTGAPSSRWRTLKPTRARARRPRSPTLPGRRADRERQLGRPLRPRRGRAPRIATTDAQE